MIYILLVLIIILLTILIIMLYRQIKKQKQYILMKKDLIEINNILDEHFKMNNDVLLSKISFKKYNCDANLLDSDFIKYVDECSIIQNNIMREIYRLKVKNPENKFNIENIIHDVDQLNIKLKNIKDLYIMFM